MAWVVWVRWKTGNQPVEEAPVAVCYREGDARLISELLNKHAAHTTSCSTERTWHVEPDTRNRLSG